MQKATVGARQVIDRLRSGIRDQAPKTAHLRRQAVAAAQSLSRRFADVTRAPAGGAHRGARDSTVSRSAARRSPGLVLAARIRRLPIRRHLARALGSERILPVGVVLLILFSAIYSLSPLGGTASAVGGTNGDAVPPRIAIGGGSGTRAAVLGDAFAAPDATQALPGTGGTDGEINPDYSGFLEDGTLLKPVVVDTSVADGRGLIVNYAVQQGDTLSGIAAQFHVSLETIWWANSLSNTYQLKIGQALLVPTVDGVVVHVAEGDTIEGLASKYGIDPGQIITVNGLQDPNLVIGQTLVMPGAKGDAIPASAQAPTPAPAPRTTTSSSTRVSAPSSYGGGAFAWPVVGGGNYISQYFHYGHYALDIAADYGTPVVAAAAGTVLFSGWKSNGGGYQVWIAHGSNLYTTYNHMSSLTVATGQSVGRGQQVGRVGMTGDATGPHCHFEVWIGPIWDGGYRVNPLNYY